MPLGCPKRGLEMRYGDLPKRHALATLLLATLVPTAAQAGPPFVTDDPGPTEQGHWEIFAFATGTESRDKTAGEAGLDINYGLAPGVQLTAVLPLTYEDEGRSRVDVGDIELAVKYRLLSQREESPLPDISFFPAVTLPTGRGAEAGRVQLFLPIWLQKDFGPWSLFGGGGYQINPGAGNRNYWTGGLGITREIGDRLSVGAEIYHQTPDEVPGRSFTGANIGLTYRLNDTWSVLLSAGPGLRNAAEGGRYAVYAALQLNL